MTEEEKKRLCARLERELTKLLEWHAVDRKISATKLNHYQMAYYNAKRVIRKELGQPSPGIEYAITKLHFHHSLIH